MAISELELTEIKESLLSGDSILSGNIDVIKDLKVKLNISLGESSLRVDDLMALKEGSVVKIDKEVNTPLEVYMKDKLVARGVMVVVDDHFGIRITEIN